MDYRYLISIFVINVCRIDHLLLNILIYFSYHIFCQHGVKRAQLIPVSGAFHTRLMESAQDPLRRVLDSVDIQTPRCKVFSGTSCEPFTTPDHIKR